MRFRIWITIKFGLVLLVIPWVFIPFGESTLWSIPLWFWTTLAGSLLYAGFVIATLSKIFNED